MSLKNKLKHARQQKTGKREKSRPVIAELVTPIPKKIPDNVIKSIEDQNYQQALAALSKERHRRFVEEYIIHPVATQAAIRAGYQEQKAASIGSMLLARTEIAAVIELGFLSIRTSQVVTRERIEEELAKLAFSNIEDLLSFRDQGVMFKDSKDIARSVMAGVSEVSSTDTKYGTSVRLRTHDKNTALAMLAKMHGLDKGGMGRPISGDPITDLLEAIQGNGQAKLTVSD